MAVIKSKEFKSGQDWKTINIPLPSCLIFADFFFMKAVLFLLSQTFLAVLSLLHRICRTFDVIDPCLVELWFSINQNRSLNRKNLQNTHPVCLETPIFAITSSLPNVPLREENAPLFVRWPGLCSSNMAKLINNSFSFIVHENLDCFAGWVRKAIIECCHKEFHSMSFACLLQIPNFFMPDLLTKM